MRSARPRPRLQGLEQAGGGLFGFREVLRAEDRLVVCGAKPARALNEACWYSLISRGFARLTEVGEDGFVRIDSAQIVRPDRETAASSAAPPPPPDFLDRPPPPEPKRPVPLAPSRPEGVELGAIPASVSPLARVTGGIDRFRRGQLIHALLQHLPGIVESERREAAIRFLAGSGVDGADAIAAEALAILNHPALAPAFGPGSRAEVPLIGVAGDQVVGGLVDRLAVLPDRVLIVDFKTNRRPPPLVEDTPAAYLRQLAAYRTVVGAIFPGLPVECGLVWTQEARVSMVPAELLPKIG